MTIDRYKDKLYVYCDECKSELADDKGKTKRYARDEFDVLIEDLRSEGWTWLQEPLTREYTHTCPDCQ